MPTYVYKTDDGEYHELIMTIEEMLARQFDKDSGGAYIKLDDGREAKRVMTPVGGSSSSVWPKRSTAAGVAPEQVEEAMNHDRQNGVPTEYDRRTGDAIYTSMGHQRKHLALHGLRDRDAFL